MWIGGGPFGYVGAAVLTALCYGASDFLAGLSARASGPRRTAVIVQASGLAALALAFPWLPHGGLPHGAGLVWPAVGGVSSALASIVYFRGLARGTMSMVALIVGVLTIVLPALVGVAWGERIGAAAMVGILGSIAAIFLVSGASVRGFGVARRGLTESVASGILFALMFVSLSRMTPTLDLTAFVLYQAVNVIVTTAFAFGLLRVVATAGRGAIAMAALSGAVGALGNLYFFAASHDRHLAIASAIAALSPFVVIALAWLLLRERLSLAQKFGAGLALACVLLISLG